MLCTRASELRNLVWRRQALQVDLGVRWVEAVEVRIDGKALCHEKTYDLQLPLLLLQMSLELLQLGV